MPQQSLAADISGSFLGSSLALWASCLGSAQDYAQALLHAASPAAGVDANAHLLTELATTSSTATARLLCCGGADEPLLNDL